MAEASPPTDKEQQQQVEDETGSSSQKEEGDEGEEGPQQQEQSAKAAVFQPLSLLDIAIRALGRRLEVLTSREYRGMVVPVDLYMRVLRSAPSQALTAERLKRIEANLPCLVHESTDEFFWKPYVAHHVHGTISMPYPAMVEKTLEQKKVLEEWVSSASANPKAQVPGPVLSTLHQLKHLPVSRRLLKDTMLAGAVGAVAKLPHDKPASLAKELRASWKQLITSTASSKAAGTEDEPPPAVDPLSPAAIGERATQIMTWKQVYEFSLEHDVLKRAAFAKRARAMRDEEESKRQKTKDMKEEEAKKKKDNRPAAGNTDRVMKLIGMKPAIGHKIPKGAGGIKFFSSKDKPKR